MLTIEIYSNTYPEFYRELTIKAAKLVKNSDLELHPIEDYDFWKLKLKDDEKTTVAKKIFNINYAPTYWRDHKSKHNIAQIKKGEEAHLPEQVRVIIPALKFMGYKVPKPLQKKIDQITEARFLYQRFLEKRFPEFLVRNHNELLVYDWRKKCFIDEIDKKELNEITVNQLGIREANPVFEDIGVDNGIIPTNDLVPDIIATKDVHEKSDKREVEKNNVDLSESIANIAHSYLDEIIACNYNRAVSYLSKKFRKSIATPYALCSGFIWTISIIDRAILTYPEEMIISRDNPLKCIVYFVEEIDAILACKSLELDYTKSNIELLYNLTECIQINGTYDEKLPYQKGKKRDAFNDIWESKIRDILHSKGNITASGNLLNKFRRLYEFTFVEEVSYKYYKSSGIKIDNIRRLPLIE